MKQNKPKVIVNSVANNYAEPNERIVEYSFGGDGMGNSIGGLILFAWINGEPHVQLYRHDKEVKITVGKAGN